MFHNLNAEEQSTLTEWFQEAIDTNSSADNHIAILLNRALGCHILDPKWVWGEETANTQSDVEESVTAYLVSQLRENDLSTVIDFEGRPWHIAVSIELIPAPNADYETVRDATRRGL